MLISLPAVIALAATGAVTAVRAQQDAGGGLVPGGSVPSYQELTLAPLDGPVRGDDPRDLRFAVRVSATSTTAPATLTIADGDAASGRSHGHLVDGSGRLRHPLMVRGRGEYQALDAPLDPVLARWDTAVTRARATIRLRQRTSGDIDGFHKTVLVTLASDTP